MAKILKKIARFNLADHVNIKLFFLMMGGFLFLTFAIPSVLILKNIRDRKAVEATLAEQTRFINSLDSSSESLKLNDFIFPEEERRVQTLPHLQREPQKTWSREEIEKYWIDLKDTGVSDFSEHNHELIDSLMDRIP